ncbi:hypothetical protein L6E12_07465 [Actinokineospora sp. PR83]|uniref:WXG100 family type VII secretion target n=1 Tax=Actinokineospora sp. PR83 TaxID=2884908 RepID=UPI001F2D58F7|nr:hypothetical protein [Actinokineospora sp. PR83]MCG8915621.1 hypothetical protein [Actinokineospora sp. PR83]
MATGQAADAAKGAAGTTDSTPDTTGGVPAGTLPPADDVYVTGGTPWESFSLAELVAMVADKASVPQLERLADDWRAAGNEVVDASDVLSTALEDLMQYWSGAAAEQARADVALNAQWVSDLGETAYRIGDPVQEAAGALKAAQDAMPQLPETPAVPPALAADSAALAEQAGGPLAAAVSGVASGTESAFTAEQEQANLKAVAVEAMRRFEGAAIGIDQATPQFEERGSTVRPRTESIPQEQVPVGPTVPPAAPTDPTARWNDLTGGPSSTSAAGYTDTRTPGTGTNDRTPANSGVGGGGGVGSFGGYTGPVGHDSDGPGAPRTPMAPSPGVGATEAVPSGGFRNGGVVGAPAAASAGAGAHAGGALGGMGGMPMGGGVAGGQGGDESEHRRRYPFGDDDSFLLTDKKASPPVIGL